MSARYQRARQRTLAATGFCLIAAGALGGCGKTGPARGGLMLVVSSDGPLSLDRLDIDVSNHNGNLFSREYRLGVDKEASLPATLAIVSNGDAAAQATISVTGWAGGVPLDQRDAIVTQIPTDRVVTLTVVLSGRCSDKLTVNLDDDKVQSSCGEGNTCNGEGDCVPVKPVVASELPVYHAGSENDAGTGGATSSAGSAGDAGMSGADASGAPLDMCAGKVCNAPPDNDCTSSAEFLSYDTVGSCKEGVCSYVSHQTACTCENHSCTMDPCALITCDKPPAAKCTGTDDETQTTYAASGTCSAASCSYKATNTPCEFGCANGACKPDPCAEKVCDEPPLAKCADASTATTYASSGTCSGEGVCSYAPTDVACGSNKQCGGAGVCAVCRADSSCGATCAKCGTGAPKCRDLGTSSQCVACLSNADCSGATPICDTSTNLCGPPSCVGLAATCGPDGSASCCASSVVTGGTFNRGNDANYPATVSDFRLDTYEITVGRFRKFWNVYPGSKPAAGSGKNPNNASDPGWDAGWNTAPYLPVGQGELTTNISCNATYQTWTAGNDNLPINCLDWFEAEAFCIWDGGRLPTEAEWNYAAAGGVQQRVYPWGSTNPDTKNSNLAVYGCYYPSGSGLCTGVTNIAPVGSSPAGNALSYGQADLAGNVWEWVQDWSSSPYKIPCNNCANTTVLSNRVIRGGGFDVNASVLLSSYRNFSGSPSLHGYYVGGRCARTR